MRPYCDFNFHDNKISNMPFLSPGAYILISGIKFEKFVRQIFSFVYPPTSRIQKIGSKSKVNFIRTFFKKTKCTHVNVKNLGRQVSGPKNMATAMVYFSKFPCGSPCMYLQHMCATIRSNKTYISKHIYLINLICRIKPPP